ncbi:MAG: hypothetical protein QGH43_11805 [Arenicellales bacterium]|jgi:hypothetical protein|nr:hypothetical protein [Arenicellales bacterium]MDP6919918.1 hypothetical protein [Arenicellales bacterium]
MPEAGPGIGVCRFIIQPNGSERAAMMLGTGCAIVFVGAAAGTALAYRGL